MLRIAVLLATAFALACGSPSGPGSDRPLRVLFIGNSLIALDDVPAITAALATAAPVRRLEVRSLAIPGRMLRDHWDSDQTQGVLEQDGPWDVVILQDVAVVSGEGRDYLEDYVGRFRDAAPGAQVALMLVWAPKSDASWFDVIRQHATSVSAATGVPLIPVGDAWQRVVAEHPDINLYSSDIYPSTFGSYLTALVTWRFLTGATTTGLPAVLHLPDGGMVELPPAVAARLQEVAG